MKLTFTQKLQIIDYYKTHRGSHSVDDIVLNLQERGFATICAQTVRRLASASRRSAPTFPDVEARLYDWIRDAERRGTRLTGGMIRAKARRIANELGFNPSGTVKFSDGWLTRFKNRYGLKHYVFQSAPVDKIDEQQRLLRAILSRYEPRNRFNVDETGLNYRSCPNNGIASHPMPGCHRREASPPGDWSRQTAKDGDPYVYGFYYKFNKNAWMTKEIWQEYLSDLNALMQHQDRRIVLLCDNASSHKHNPSD
ncbi:hypothetical protein RSOLAG22IIIB_11403 [Rhizoctonia solani]|uniref:HTH CENPB-type domain-containing protein n=1 Tax=Rhizoctonia solani TaxID=456999 RepID=A0A0K6G7S7_9AGAM|nr:hypothetical protein RSOLAG22IIIB_11403 [Rhizoctonia solani]